MKTALEKYVLYFLKPYVIAKKTKRRKNKFLFIRGSNFDVFFC